MLHFKLPRTKTRSHGAVTQQLNAPSSDVTPAPAPSGKQILTKHCEPHSHKHSRPCMRLSEECWWQIYLEEAHLFHNCAYRWGRCCATRLVRVCVSACTYVGVCVCVFVGLSDEPGQSVRCGNGGFKDKRCGEFPGCLLPKPPPPPILPYPSPISCCWDAERRTGTQADTWIDKAGMQEGS